jgi:hypothetical protein
MAQSALPPVAPELKASADDIRPITAEEAQRLKARVLVQSQNRREEQTKTLDIVYPITDDGPLPALADAWPRIAGPEATGERLPSPNLQSPESQTAFSAGHKATLPAGDQALVAVHQQMNAANQKAIKLAQRGALYSARSELLEALRVLAQAQGARDGTSQRVAALSAALTAMEESDDFTQSARAASVAVSDVIRPHQTPVLKSIDATRLSHLTCSQHYFAYAQQQLNVATGGDAVAAQTLYLLGKVHSHLAGQSVSIGSAHTARAMVFHQATLAIDPTHYQSANELGVLLARFGELSAARQMLLASVTSRATPSAWQNLASVHERLGETDLASRARYEAQLMSGKTPTTDGGQSVQWVDATTFAAQSPADGAMAAAASGKTVRAAAAAVTRPRASTMRR